MELGGFRFEFSSQDRDHHPTNPHVHVVKRGVGEAKFKLKPVRLDRNRGLKGHDLTKVEAIIRENRQFMLEEWNEFFAG